MSKGSKNVLFKNMRLIEIFSLACLVGLFIVKLLTKWPPKLVLWTLESNVSILINEILKLFHNYIWLMWQIYCIGKDSQV
jgi:hypothetical protein